MYRDLDPEYTPGVYSSDSAFCSSMPINQAVLKPLKQVCKEKPVHDSHLSPVSYPDICDPSQPPNKDFNDTSYNKEKEISCRPSDSIDDIDCDIKREDYYRASQIFYSSMRMKNRLGVSPKKSASNTIKSISENMSPVTPQKKESKSFKKIESLDRDIGLPIPACKMPSKPDTPTKVSDISSEKVDFNADSSTNKTSEVIKKLDFKHVDKLVKKDLPIENKDVKNEKEIVKKETKKNLTYEELRGQLLRKREAPPPNIVQDRIKKFEKVKTNDENKKPLCHSKLLENLPTHKFANRSFSKRNRLKNSRSRLQKRVMHSDSEAVAFDDSDASSDDLTMRSAPILLSPLSSVLADLRKTADSGKERLKDIPPDNSIKKDCHSKISTCPSTKVPHKSSLLSDFHSASCNDFMQNVDDAVYLPMYGIKALEEPEYVTMSGSKFSSSAACSKYKPNKYNEEHVYNEPFSPPPSFLHDVYGKQRSKQFQYEIDSSSSDDSVTENIYEKPTQRFSLDSCRNIKSAQETNFILMSSSSCTNVSGAGNVIDKRVSPNRIHHYEQAHISVSVPDLLQLQEIQDSDASDADDEASRDFDAPSSSASYASKSLSTNLDPFLSHPHIVDPTISSSHIKSKPLYEKICKENSSGDIAAFIQSCCAELPRADTDDSEKILHVRKLRVYTKGKKPEMPRMFPGHFNMEESEPTDSKYKTAELLSENLAYGSRSDIQSNGEDSDASLSVQAACYAPDIISSIKEESSVSDTSFSKSNASAPYYYSDLYSEYGLNFSGQLQLNLSAIDKISSPKSSTSLLNNIRSKSPCANKGDIGRKVNNINVDTRNRQACNDKPVTKYANDDETKNNIRHSLDVYQVSESKYLHAEKNKYEAGSTLEKTRTSNTMSCLKQRASTPELNQANEPVYENMFFQSKRVSQSLEEISAASKFLSHDEHKELALQVYPVYENIDIYKRSVDKPLKVHKHKQIQFSDTLRISGEASHSNDSTSGYRKINADGRQKECFPDMLDDVAEAVNDQVHFLDKSTLKCVDKQSLHSISKLCSGETDIILNDPRDTVIRSPLNFGSLKDSCNYHMTSSSETIIYKVPKHKMNDLDSVSDATSSWDEGNIYLLKFSEIIH